MFSCSKTLGKLILHNMGHLLVLAGVGLFTVRLGTHYCQTLVKLFFAEYER